MNFEFQKIRARVVYPGAQPAIPNGGLAIARGRIAGIGVWKEVDRQFPGAAQDVGEVIVMPGLINAHCHLDYTDMAGAISPSQSFADWIQAMLACKSAWSYSEFAHSWLAGARMLLEQGTAWVMDIESAPELIPEVWPSTPLRVWSCFELIGIQKRRQPRSLVAEAARRIESLPLGRCRAGLSPHAPYSTRPELLRLAAQIAAEKNWKLAIHAAESLEEFQMFVERRGRLYDWLRSQREMDDCDGTTPVAHLERTGCLGSNTLVVHANFLTRGDVDMLRRRNCAVAHCPRSHDYFGHRAFPYAELRAARVTICLGTDSLATVKKRGRLRLDLFEEMRCFSAANPFVAPEEIIAMTTLNPARALGLEGESGALQPGARADFILLPFSGKTEECAAAILSHRGPVRQSFIDGASVFERAAD